MPHISLMYSDPRSNLVGEYVNSLTDFPINKINVIGLELWKTSGPVDIWKCIRRKNL
jgi:hypothetical protein